MNTKPVDVLEAMSYASDCLDEGGYQSAWRELDKARSAIAELIAADEEYNRALNAQGVASGIDAVRDADNRVTEAIVRRAAALARVKGET